MHPDQILTVQTSLEQALAQQNTLAPLFYSRLFELDPSLWLLFRGDIWVQGNKLVNTLRFMVNHLEELAELEPMAQELGRKHQEYGVRPEDYETARQALLWALAQQLEEDFTPEVEAAWDELYTFLARLMQEKLTS